MFWKNISNFFNPDDRDPYWAISEQCGDFVIEKQHNWKMRRDINNHQAGNCFAQKEHAEYTLILLQQLFRLLQYKFYGKVEQLEMFSATIYDITKQDEYIKNLIAGGGK